MESFATICGYRKLLRIALAAGISVSLYACKSSNPQSLAPTPEAEQTVKAPAKPTGAKKPIERNRLESAEVQEVAKLPEVTKPAETAALVQPTKSAKSDARAWGTVYYIQAAQAYSGAGGVSLRGPDGRTLGTSLSVKDFCRAAREGTVAVSGGRMGTFNHAGWTDAAQADCSKVFPRIRRDEVARFERTVFEPVPPDAPEGLGSDSRYRLVPYRTVAVDKSVFPLGSVLFIPKLKGKQTPIGVHDGYVFAGDTGVGVNGPHLDFFLGRTTSNPAPDVFTGGPATRFDVQIVSDNSVIQRLRRQHLR